MNSNRENHLGLKAEASRILAPGGTGRYVLYNGTVYTPWESFFGGIAVHGEAINLVFAGSLPENMARDGNLLIDCRGGRILPGFIDLHLHGARGHDFTLASPEGAIRAVSYHTAAGGTTTLMPTLVSAPLEQIKQAAAMFRQTRAKINAPYLAGIHLEGPFFNPWYRGAHPEAYLASPKPDLIEDLMASLGDVLGMVTISPELPRALEVIARLDYNGIVTAAGHSGATFEKIEEAAALGLRHVVHTYSAMRRFHHRSPGVLGAALTLDHLSAEIIADGIHTHPAAVKLFFRAKPANKTVLATDALAVCGLPESKCRLGEKTITNYEGKALLEDGTLAGSTLTMNRALAGAVKMADLPLEKALPAATINPARVLGLDHKKGSLEKGKDADITVIDARYNVMLTICQGKPFLET